MAILYGFFRSSAVYRVRIALALKGLPYDTIPVNLSPDVSAQKKPDYKALNPQGRVPFWVDETVHLSQSTAILEYLEEAHSETPLLPNTPVDRAYVRQLVNLIACDIHPLNNLTVLSYLRSQFGADEAAVNNWYVHWILEGFTAFEKLLEEHGSTSMFCRGTKPTLADVYLVPQVYNARRFKAPLDAFPRIVAIDKHCNSLAAFQRALPENQTDAP